MSARINSLAARAAHRSSAVLLAASVVLAAAGCAGTQQLLGFNSYKFDKADAKNPAVEVLALWQPTEGPGPNGVPTRGFAGEIFFITQANPVPVMVEGKTRIYLFDDRGTPKEQARPISETDFDVASWRGHCHKSTLGPGYAVFIPYPRVDFHQASCSLRIRFTPVVGPTIYSPTASVVLSGPLAKPADSEAPQTPSLGARQSNAANPLAARLAQGNSGSSGAAGSTFPAGPVSGANPAVPGSYFPPASSGSPPSGRALAGNKALSNGLPQNALPAGAMDPTARPTLSDNAGSFDAILTQPIPTTDQAPLSSARIKLQSADADSSDAGED